MTIGENAPRKGGIIINYNSVQNSVCEYNTSHHWLLNIHSSAEGYRPTFQKAIEIQKNAHFMPVPILQHCCHLAQSCEIT